MAVDKVKAAQVLRRAAALAPTAAIKPHWAARIAKLKELLSAAGVVTHYAFVATSLLAKATDPAVDLYAVKPSHSSNSAGRYSARDLSEQVVVPIALELGFSIGSTGRQPLNNQPYFRMERLTADVTVRGGKTQVAFNYVLELIAELQAGTSASAMDGLIAYIAAMKIDAAKYGPASDGVEIQVQRLIAVIEEFVSENSEGGRRAQAVVAGLMDLFAGVERVESGRINDPSRKYPGDVCIRPVGSESGVEKSIEVRDKPVTDADIRLFVQRCLSFGVREAAVVMVASRQLPVDAVALAMWAEARGVGLTLFQSWRELVGQTMFWSSTPSPRAAIDAARAIYDRLVGVEASPEAVAQWNKLALE